MYIYIYIYIYAYIYVYIYLHMYIYTRRPFFTRLFHMQTCLWLTHTRSLTRTHIVAHTRTHTRTHTQHLGVFQLIYQVCVWVNIKCAEAWTQNRTSKPKSCIPKMPNIEHVVHKAGLRWLCMHTHAHICTHTLTHRFTHTYTHTYIHTHTHTYARTHTHRRTHTHTHAHKYTHTQTHTHRRTHAHTHTCEQDAYNVTIPMIEALVTWSRWIGGSRIFVRKLC